MGPKSRGLHIFKTVSDVICWVLPFTDSSPSSLYIREPQPFLAVIPFTCDHYQCSKVMCSYYPEGVRSRDYAVSSSPGENTDAVITVRWLIASDKCSWLFSLLPWCCF